MIKTVEAATAVKNETVVAGAASTFGKIGTVAAAATLYVALDTHGTHYSRADWRVKCNKSHSYQLFRARTNVLSGTVVLTDATAVDADDTFVFNGLTFTYKATANASDASRYIDLGANNGEAATNTAALLSNATYGIPGLTSAASVAGTGIDTITLVSGTNTALQFAQGTSASNEVAWSSTTLASLIEHSSLVTGKAANTTTSGYSVEQYVDGWPFCFIAITNNDGSDAATVVVGATPY